jgi:hypothetical protein
MGRGLGTGDGGGVSELLPNYSTMTECRMCKVEKNLVKAHIVPRAFQMHASLPEETPRVFSSNPARHPKRSPIGAYDPKILCSECDGNLGKLDQYASETLLSGQRRRVDNQIDGTIAGYEYGSADPIRLAAFVASVAWRASISNRDEFTAISLGPYEERVMRALQADAFTLPQGVSIVLAEWDRDDVPQLYPHEHRFNGARTWLFYADRFIFYVKVAKTPFLSPFRDAELRPDSPVRTFVRNWTDSRERELMSSIVQRAPNPF